MSANNQNPLTQYPTAYDIFNNLEKVTGLYFNGKTIRVDGYHFIGCRFDNCLLEVMTDNFIIEKCVIDERCNVNFYGGPTRVIQLFSRIYENPEATFGREFSPTRHKDGSITIRGWHELDI